jgi:hypothetical protein
MQLCFVSVNGPRETYFVDEPRIKKDIETLIDTNKEVGVELNVKRTKYMLLSRHQNVGENYDKNNSKQVI